MNKFEKMYNPLGLRVPKSFPRKNVLKFGAKIEHPDELILSGYTTPVEDQGDKPFCAAYSASSFAESVLWRKTGKKTQVNPDPLYFHAKTIDGDPTGDGTYLECTLDALLEKKYFDRAVCKVKTFGGGLFGIPDGLESVKNTIHRYGVCIAGFDITGEWFNPKGGVIRGDGSKSQGGHAVTLVGYDKGGVLILNSWGKSYAKNGFVYITNKAFEEQFMYGAVLTRCLDGLS